MTITKKKNVDWDSIKPKILSKILEFFSLESQLIQKKKSQMKEENYNEKDLKLLNKLKN